MASMFSATTETADDPQMIHFRRLIREQLSTAKIPYPSTFIGSNGSASCGERKVPCVIAPCMMQMIQRINSSMRKTVMGSTTEDDLSSSSEIETTAERIALTKKELHTAIIEKGLSAQPLAEHLNRSLIKTRCLAEAIPGSLDELFGKHKLTFAHLIENLDGDVYDLCALGMSPSLLIDHWDTCDMPSLNSHMLAVNKRTLYDWFRMQQGYTLEEIVFSGFLSMQKLKAIGATEAILQLDGLHESVLSGLMLALHNGHVGLDILSRVEFVANGKLPSIRDVLTDEP